MHARTSPERHKSPRDGRKTSGGFYGVVRRRSCRPAGARSCRMCVRVCVYVRMCLSIDTVCRASARALLTCPPVDSFISHTITVILISGFLQHSESSKCPSPSDWTFRVSSLASVPPLSSVLSPSDLSSIPPFHYRQRRHVVRLLAVRRNPPDSTNEERARL